VDEDDSAIDDEPSDAVADETGDCVEDCDDTNLLPADASRNDSEPSQPLFNTSERLPVTEVQITFDERGAVVSESNQQRSAEEVSS